MSTVVESQEMREGGWQDEATALVRRVGPPMAVGIAVLTALSAGVGLLVIHGLDGAVDDLDLDVARDLVAGRTATIDGLTSAATVLADTVTVSGLWIGSMAVAAWRTRKLTIPVFLLAAIGGEKLTYLFTSIIIGRPRPPVEPLGHVFATNSFPSGHVGSAIVLYGGIGVAILWHDAAARGRWRPAPVWIALGAVVTAITLLVAYSRLYRGHHFLSDVVWGAVLGIVWLALAWRVVLRSPTGPGACT